MRKLVIFLGIFFLLYASTMSVTAESTERTASFTTSKGTIVKINATFEHDGLNNGKPSFMVNDTYELQITVAVTSLGAEVRDFHDITLEISIESGSLIGDALPFYKGYFFDSETRLTTNSSVSYSIDMFITGDNNDHDAELSVKLSGKENIGEARDPTSEFDAVTAEVVVNPSATTNNITNLAGTEQMTKSIENYASKDSKVKFEFFMMHEGLSNSSSKPTILSKNRYAMNFKVTLVELGADARDIHDFSIRVKLVDESISDLVPGNDPSEYYGGGVDDTTRLTTVGQSITLNLVFFASTNVNNSEVAMTITLSVKEDVEFIDPTSDFEIGASLILNEGQANVFDQLLSQTNDFDVYTPYFIFITIPILVKLSKKQR
ncbi:MAG: hypothetical protein INQ03_05700 [Candidatus Heimdallarchaeota archaeon]|nr:hypothetical protein [Candidatus Heimdallarchaeota archaeon]